MIYADSLYLVSGGFVLLSGGASKLPTSLSSPVINTHAHGWKCFRFSFNIGWKDSFLSLCYFNLDCTVSLTVLLQGETTNQVFLEDKVTNETRYIQIPLPRNLSNAKVSVHQEYAPILFNVIKFQCIDQILNTTEEEVDRLLITKEAWSTQSFSFSLTGLI